MYLLLLAACLLFAYLGSKQADDTDPPYGAP